jgi:hypothetical protein
MVSVGSGLPVRVPLVCSALLLQPLRPVTVTFSLSLNSVDKSPLLDEQLYTNLYSPSWHKRKARATAAAAAEGQPEHDMLLMRVSMHIRRGV